MGAGEISEFLTHLTSVGNVSATEPSAERVVVPISKCSNKRSLDYRSRASQEVKAHTGGADTGCGPPSFKPARRRVRGGWAGQRRVRRLAWAVFQAPVFWEAKG